MMRKYLKNIMWLILIVGLLTIGMQACEWVPEDEEIIPEEPAMTIFNDSRMDLLIHYNLDADATVDAVIKSGETYEIESGVTEITIDGGYF